MVGSVRAGDGSSPMGPRHHTLQRSKDVARKSWAQRRHRQFCFHFFFSIKSHILSHGSLSIIFIVLLFHVYSFYLSIDRVATVAVISWIRRRSSLLPGVSIPKSRPFRTT
jgi:hypothetical protein